MQTLVYNTVHDLYVFRLAFPQAPERTQKSKSSGNSSVLDENYYIQYKTKLKFAGLELDFEVKFTGLKKKHLVSTSK